MPECVAGAVMKAVEPWAQFVRDVPRMCLQSEKRSVRGLWYREMSRAVLSRFRSRTLNAGDPMKLSGFRPKKDLMLYVLVSRTKPRVVSGFVRLFDVFYEENTNVME